MVELDGTVIAPWCCTMQNFLQLTKEGALPCNELGNGTSGMGSDGRQYGVSGSPFFWIGCCIGLCVVFIGWVVMW